MTQEPTTERIEPTDGEPLPNGGAYAIVYYQDIDGGPAPKPQALRAEVFEYSVENAPIAMTIIDLTLEDTTDD